MDININISIKALEKLFGLFGEAVKGYFRPVQIRRIAKAEAEADRIKRTEAAKTDSEVGEIQIFARAELEELKNQQLALIDQREIPDDSSAILAAAQKDRDRRLIEAQFNMAQIASLAAEELAGVPDDKVSDTPIDHDLFTQFRDKAEKVSDEQMQQLWARVLAGEVKEPGTTSLRTLDFLSKMSKQDAELIEKLCPFAIFLNGILFTEGFQEELENLFNENGLPVWARLKLSELGIIEKT